MYTDNYKSLMENYKRSEPKEGRPMFMDRNEVIEMSTPPKAVHRLNAGSVKISKALLTEVEKQS